MNKWLLRIGGFLIGAIAVVAIEALIVYAFSRYHYRLIPRGLGWIAMPVFAGIGGARFAEHLAVPLMSRIANSPPDSLGWRRICLGTICWVTAVFLWAFAFDGLGRYWYHDDWMFFWKVVAIPPLFAAASYWLFSKFG